MDDEKRRSCSSQLMCALYEEMKDCLILTAEEAYRLMRTTENLA